MGPPPSGASNHDAPPSVDLNTKVSFRSYSEPEQELLFRAVTYKLPEESSTIFLCGDQPIPLSMTEISAPSFEFAPVVVPSRILRRHPSGESSRYSRNVLGIISPASPADGPSRVELGAGLTGSWGTGIGVANGTIGAEVGV